ncbi:S8 family serine peptidase [Paenibacillus humicola]|uniref:S8 family serine peptidase n=1 Tax=Paenibacillus humicola TaxID=3110540 RepID=UPI00237C1149|nr:S8 family serine peptidase [Paenibacillus humicola]
MKRRLPLIFKAAAALCSLLLIAANFTYAAPSSSDRHSYLVNLKPGKSVNALNAPGIQLKKHWDDLGAANIVADPDTIQKLKNNPDIESIEEDRPVHATALGQTYTDGELTWGLQAVHAEQAWSQNATGSHIRVCVLDSGIDAGHPEFYRNGTSIIKASQNFVDDGHPDAADGFGHGTHVSGTIAGQTSASGSRIGVAPGVDLYVARVLGDDGNGLTSGVIAGLNWCQENKANIANLSLGSDEPSHTEQKAFDRANMNGMLIIAASGNDSLNHVGYPAGYKSVVAVGAVDSSLNLASFSDYGKDQELVGPGVGTLSSVPRGTGLHASAVKDGDSTSYHSNPLEFSGTGSVSGPLVDCGIADSAATCGGKPASGAWIAVIDRGTNAFSEKVQNAMSQGASAAVIVNNDTANPDDPGNFTLGAAGSWIPAVSLSYNQGTALRSGGLGTGKVEVTPWDYSYYEGTSMATPHVTGVAALAWSANPGLTNDQIRKVIESTAVDLGAPRRDNMFGYGLVQADAAVQMARSMH